MKTKILFACIALLLSVTGVFANVYFGNIHAHTSFSDGFGTPEEAFSYAWQTGAVQIQGVTDHGHDLNYPLPDGAWKFDRTGTAALAATIPGEFLAIRGYEWTLTGQGHITIYTTDSWMDRGRAGLFEIYEWMESQQAIAQFCHPGKKYGDFFDFTPVPRADAFVQLCEVGNGAGSTNNVIKEEYLDRYRRALTRGWHVGATANQDNHDTNWGTANQARTAFVMDELTIDCLYKAMRERSTYATEDANALVGFWCDRGKMGQVIWDTQPATLTLSYSDAMEPLRLAEVHLPGQVFPLEVSGDSFEVCWTLPGGKPYTWCFVRLVQMDGNEIVTSPIWFQSPSGAYLLNPEWSTPFQVSSRPFFFSFDLVNTNPNPVTLAVQVFGDTEPRLEERFRLPGMEATRVTMQLDSPATRVELLVNGQLSGTLFPRFKRFFAMLDTTHENYFLRELAPLIELMERAGGAVSPLLGELNPQSLKDPDLLLLPLPDPQSFLPEFMVLSPDQIELLEAFVQQGGTLVIVLAKAPVDFPEFDSYRQLLERLGLPDILQDGGTRIDPGVFAENILFLSWEQACGEEPLPVDFLSLLSF